MLFFDSMTRDLHFSATLSYLKIHLYADTTHEFFMTRIRTFLIASLIGFASASIAQTFTLEQCIVHALSHNSGFASEQLEKQKQELSLKQSHSAYLPTLNGQAEHNYNQGRSYDLATNDYSENSFQSGSMGLSAGADLFKGFQRKYTISLQEHLLDLQVSQLEIAQNKLALAVADAYMQALFANESAKSTQLQLDITANELGKMRVLADAGVRPKSDILRMQAQEESERADLLYQQGQEAGSLLRLQQLMEFKADSTVTERFLIVTNLDGDVGVRLLSADSALAGADNLPEIVATDARIRSAQEQVKISKSYRSPQLSAHAYYGTLYSTLNEDPIGSQIGNSRNAQLGVRLTVPIFNQFQNRTAVAQTKISVLQAENAKTETLKDLHNRVESTYLDAVSALNRLEAAQKSADFYTESFRMSQVQLEAGALSATDFNTEKTALSAAETKLIRLKFELLYHRLMLNYFATGTITL